MGTGIAHELRARGHEVRALVRRPERASRLASWSVELAPGDVTDPASLAAAAEGCTHAIHLVGVIGARPEQYERVMVQGTRHLLDAARAAGVRRFVHMSALGVDERTRTLVPYYGAKWEMERAVQSSGIEHVIFRPSFVFGRGGGILPTFVRQVRLSPVVTVLGPGTGRLQPIWLGDLAAHFAAALDEPAAAGRTFELGGPDSVTWDELYRRIARVLGKRRVLVHVPFPVARAGALLTGWIPGAPLTVEQVTMLEAGDNVVSDPAAEQVFGLPRLPLDEQLRRALA